MVIMALKTSATHPMTNLSFITAGQLPMALFNHINNYGTGLDLTEYTYLAVGAYNEIAHNALSSNIKLYAFNLVSHDAQMNNSFIELVQLAVDFYIYFSTTAEIAKGAGVILRRAYENAANTFIALEAIRNPELRQYMNQKTYDQATATVNFLQDVKNRVFSVANGAEYPRPPNITAYVNQTRKDQELANPGVKLPMYLGGQRQAFDEYANKPINPSNQPSPQDSSYWQWRNSTKQEVPMQNSQQSLKTIGTTHNVAYQNQGISMQNYPPNNFNQQQMYQQNPQGMQYQQPVMVQSPNQQMFVMDQYGRMVPVMNPQQQQPMVNQGVDLYAAGSGFNQMPMGAPNRNQQMPGGVYTAAGGVNVAQQTSTLGMGVVLTNRYGNGNQQQKQYPEQQNNQRVSPPGPSTSTNNRYANTQVNYQDNQNNFFEQNQTPNNQKVDTPVMVSIDEWKPTITTPYLLFNHSGYLLESFVRTNEGVFQEINLREKGFEMDRAQHCLVPPLTKEAFDQKMQDISDAVSHSTFVDNEDQLIDNKNLLKSHVFSKDAHIVDDTNDAIQTAMRGRFISKAPIYTIYGTRLNAGISDQKEWAVTAALASADSFTGLRSVLLMKKTTISEPFLERLNSYYTKIVMSFLHNNLGLSNLKIESFVDDLDDLISYFDMRDRKDQTNFMTAFNTFSKDLLSNKADIVFDESFEKFSEDLVGYENAAEMGLYAQIMPIGYTATSIDQSSFVFAGDRVGNQVRCIQQLTATPQFELIKNIFDKNEANASGAYENLIVTSDMVVFRVYKSYLLHDTYLIIRD